MFSPLTKLGKGFPCLNFRSGILREHLIQTAQQKKCDDTRAKTIEFSNNNNNKKNPLRMDIPWILWTSLVSQDHVIKMLKVHSRGRGPGDSWGGEAVGPCEAARVSVICLFIGLIVSNMLIIIRIILIFIHRHLSLVMLLLQLTMEMIQYCC